MPANARIRVLAIAACCLIAMPGCGLRHWVHIQFKVGPNHCRPSASVVTDWQDSPDRRVNLSLPEHSDWWSTFNDPALNDLFATARRQNLSLREAGWRIQQARDARRIVAGNLFPQLQQVTGNYRRSLASQAPSVPSPVRAFAVDSIQARLPGVHIEVRAALSEIGEIVVK